MDSLFELFFGSLYDKAIFKTKQLRAQIILISYSKKNTWMNESKHNQAYKKIVINDEILLNLFLDKAFRNEDLMDIEKRKEFIANIEKAMTLLD